MGAGSPDFGGTPGIIGADCTALGSELHGQLPNANARAEAGFIVCTTSGRGMRVRAPVTIVTLSLSAYIFYLCERLGVYGKGTQVHCHFSTPLTLRYVVILPRSVTGTHAAESA